MAHRPPRAVCATGAASGNMYVKQLEATVSPTCPRIWFSVLIYIYMFYICFDVGVLLFTILRRLYVGVFRFVIYNFNLQAILVCYYLL